MSRNTRSRLMVVVAIIFGFYSILWGIAPYESINFPSRLILDSLDWPIDRLSTQLDKNTMLLSAIGAGLLGAIAIFLGGIVAPAIKEGNKSITRIAIIAMIVWYVIDGTGSIASGAASNVVFNSIYLAVILTPLLWKDVNEST